jgi:hypothetical protein
MSETLAIESSGRHRRPRPRGHLSEPDIRDIPVLIYGLAEPGTWSIRYVGKSADPIKRLTNHASRYGSYRVFHWMQGLRAKSLRPQLVILAVVRPGDDAAAAELATIRALEASGARLLNYFGLRRPGRKLDSRRPDRIVRECKGAA